MGVELTPVRVELMAFRVDSCAGRYGRMERMTIPRLPMRLPSCPPNRCAALARWRGSRGRRRDLSACTSSPTAASAVDRAGRLDLDRRGGARRRRRGDRRHRARGVDAALVGLHRLAGRGRVHLAAGAAELRQPRRQEDHDRAVDDPGHRAGRQAAGRAAGQPGRPRRARPRRWRPRSRPGISPQVAASTTSSASTRAGWAARCPRSAATRASSTGCSRITSPPARPRSRC